MGTSFNNFWFAPLILVGSVASWQAQAAEMDFEGLAEGEIVSEVSTGAGVSGNLKGTVSVFGFNPGFGVGTNAAVVYDSDCLPSNGPADCSGEDADLGSPNDEFGGPGIGSGGEAGSAFENNTALSNVLIVGEDLVDDSPDDGFVDDPDDADLREQFLEFDFSDVKGGGKVTVNSVTYMDNDEGEFGAQIEMFGPGIPDQFIGLAATGSNGVNTIDGIGVDGVRLLRVVLNGSGASQAW